MTTKPNLIGFDGQKKVMRALGYNKKKSFFTSKQICIYYFPKIQNLINPTRCIFQQYILYVLGIFTRVDNLLQLYQSIRRRKNLRIAYKLGRRDCNRRKHRPEIV